MIRLIALLLLTACAGAPDDCAADRYQPPQVVSINRPISVVQVDVMPKIDGCTGQWACAANAFGQGRAIIYVRRDHLSCVYHELAHANGWKHPEGR